MTGHHFEFTIQFPYSSLFNSFGTSDKGNPFSNQSFLGWWLFPFILMILMNDSAVLL